jgi:hypothetical protein
MNDTKIRIANPDFAILRQINEAPFKKMWVRELLRNCIEATINYKKSHTIDIPTPIKVRALKLNDFFGPGTFSGYKVSFLNYGGMTGGDLRLATNFYSSVGKTQSDRDNYGVGAKLMTMGFGQTIFITYKKGIASTAMLAIENGAPTRLGDIIECTDWVKENAESRGYDLDHDWTEVILYGKEDKQDTFKHPYGTDLNKQESNVHLIRQAFDRFYDIPEGIEILFETRQYPVHSKGKTYPSGVKLSTYDIEFNSKVIQKYPNAFSKKVSLEDGTELVYYYDPKKDTDNQPASYGYISPYCESVAKSYLVWGKVNERECYSLVDMKKWQRFATQLGILVDHKCFKVDVILPYQKYKSTTYRDNLLPIDAFGDNTPVEYKDFLLDVKNNMPDEWVEKIKEHNATRRTENIDDRIKQHMAEYYGDFRFDGVAGKKLNGTTETRSPSKNKQSKKASSKLRPRPNPNRKAGAVTVSTPEFVENPDIAGNFFVSYVDAGYGSRDTIYYNPLHKSVDQFFNKIVFEDDADPEVISAVRHEACELLKVKVGAKIIFAKSQKNSDWFDDDTFTAVTKASSLQLDVLQNELLIPSLRKFKSEKEKEIMLDT